MMKSLFSDNLGKLSLAIATVIVAGCVAAPTDQALTTPPANAGAATHSDEISEDSLLAYFNSIDDSQCAAAVSCESGACRIAAQKAACGATDNNILLIRAALPYRSNSDKVEKYVARRPASATVNLKPRKRVVARVAARVAILQLIKSDDTWKELPEKYRSWSVDTQSEIGNRLWKDGVIATMYSDTTHIRDIDGRGLKGKYRLVFIIDEQWEGLDNNCSYPSEEQVSKWGLPTGCNPTVSDVARIECWQYVEPAPRYEDRRLKVWVERSVFTTGQDQTCDVLVKKAKAKAKLDAWDKS